MRKDMNDIFDLLQTQLKAQKAQDAKFEKLVQDQKYLIELGDLSKLNAKQLANKVQKLILEIEYVPKMAESIAVTVKAKQVEQIIKEEKDSESEQPGTAEASAELDDEEIFTTSAKDFHTKKMTLRETIFTHFHLHSSISAQLSFAS